MNRNLGAIYASTKQRKFETRGSVHHKSFTKSKNGSEAQVDMESIVKLWEDTQDKYITLKRLGKLFKQINKSHDDDLIK